MFDGIGNPGYSTYGVGIDSEVMPILLPAIMGQILGVSEGN